MKSDGYLPCECYYVILCKGSYTYAILMSTKMTAANTTNKLLTEWYLTKYVNLFAGRTVISAVNGWNFIKYMAMSYVCVCICTYVYLYFCLPAASVSTGESPKSEPWDMIVIMYRHRAISTFTIRRLSTNIQKHGDSWNHSSPHPPHPYKQYSFLRHS